MLGEVRPATRKSPPLFGITCIHCGAEMTDEFVPELIQRWNTRVTATASIDKEVMEGAFDKERRDVAARLWKHIGKPLFTGQDVEDIIGVQRSDFDVVLADASYRRLADLIQSILWYAIAAIWALIAIARWLSGEPEGSDAMTHFGIAFILANIFELRSEMGKIGEK